MWALRRGSVNLRKPLLSLGAAQCTGRPEITKFYLQNCTNGIVETQERTFDGPLFSARFSNNFYSSAVWMATGGNSSGGEDDSVEHDESSSLAKAMIVSGDTPVHIVLEKWIEEGNEVTHAEVSAAVNNLEKRRMFRRALRLSELLQSSKQIEFQEDNYAFHASLLARLVGSEAAEQYVEKIPESFRGELLFNKLLTSYIFTTDVKNSLRAVERMKELGIPLTTDICNKLLFLYLKTDKKQIANVLALMEEKSIKPNSFTYWVLIRAKGQSNDITGMEQVVEAMKAEGMEPTTEIKVAIARSYVNSGLRDKADAFLKELEGDDLEENAWLCRHLLPLYASMGREDEVERIWKICEPNARMSDLEAAVEAWGKLKRVEKAEAAFEKIMMKAKKKPFSKTFMPMLKVYADNKMLGKAKELVEQMEKAGCNQGPPVWDSFIKLYLGLGDLKGAVAVLEKGTQFKKAMRSSYCAILQAASCKGDVHNAEKMISEMKKAGYLVRLAEYRMLLQTYVIAKIPVYGFVERMKVDNVSPDPMMSRRLADMAKSGFKKFQFAA